MTQASPNFRPARITDAASLAVLVDIAGEGMPAHMWRTMTAPGQSLLELGHQRARRDTGGLIESGNRIDESPLNVSLVPSADIATFAA